MRRGRWIAAALLAAMGTSFRVGLAATVRGKVVRKSGVVAGVQVTVLNNGTKARTSPVRSGTDGMYSIPNVPAGTYTLEIWPAGAKAPYTVNGVTVSEPETDIHPVIVP
jgi:hypothetical protein